MSRLIDFRRALLGWYEKNRRDLPWRRTSDPYRIWLSEIMLQQTRVAAAIPYYERFLERFPTVEALARATENEVLVEWAGLGYYSRARNLHKAAREIAALNAFPQTYDAIRELPGVGDYTAAAVASIAFGLPHAVLDGNVARVLARLDDNASDIKAPRVRRLLQQRADELLDAKRPSLSNQAMMELGAAVCLPREPRCGECPVSRHCAARKSGRQNELPILARKAETVRVARTLLVVRRGRAMLLARIGEEASKLSGFWELPDADRLPEARIERIVGHFAHSITVNRYRITVALAAVGRTPRGMKWLRENDLAAIPVTTATRKALACLNKGDGG